MRLRYRTTIPLIGNAQAALAGQLSPDQVRRVVMAAEKRTRNAALIKPGRRLGAPWIDMFVAQRRSVSVCKDCERRYGDWHIRHNYHKRARLELTDCDGCGQNLLCSAYYSAIM